MRWLGLGALLLALALLLLMLDAFPNRIIFPTDAVPAAGPLPPGAETLTVRTEDGETLHGVLIPPSREAEERLLVLGFGGNAWNGQDVAEYLHDAYPQAHVVAFHYRGYRPSTGSPSPAALLADAPLTHDLAASRVKPERTVAVGFSIGSGVAAGLSARRPLDGLILVTPFDSLKALAQGLFPWLPVGAFLKEDLATADLLSGNPVPTAILAGERDEIVPAERTEALRSRAGNLVFDRTIAGAGHNDIYARAEFRSAMDEALSAISPAE